MVYERSYLPQFISKTSSNIILTETRATVYVYDLNYHSPGAQPSPDIVRLLFMVPLYAIISFASFMFWVGFELPSRWNKLNLLWKNQSTPIILVRDAYEAIVLTAFFYLLLMYISHDPEEQKRVFLKKGLSKEADLNAVHRGVSPVKWVFPMGFIKWKPRVCLHWIPL